MKKKNKEKKILFISASGGHLEQLMMLRPLMDKYQSVVVTEKTKINSKADYYMVQSGAKQKPVILRLIANILIALYIFIKERPTHIISTGGLIGVPFIYLSKFSSTKVIFIETFAKVHDGTRTGKLMYKHADLFIVQWESLLDIYPNATYGGSIY
jgi:beta-1,4-N-acetylglucosaminyltransferase